MEIKLEKDGHSYVKQQEIFTGEMTARILEHLEDAGLTGDKLKDTCGKIAFEIASMIDCTSDIEFDGESAYPYLTFLKNSESDTIIHLGGNSYCHELVYGILNALLSNET